MKDVFELEPHTRISPEDSYVIAYPYILAHFQSLNNFTVRDFVCVAHIVYGWMPTILHLNPGEPINLRRGGELLTQARRDGNLADTDIEQLVGLVNNSLVGVSKLLHFTAPNAFAIWDSKIYSFIFEEQPYNYRVNRIFAYREYMSRLQHIKERSGFAAFHASVNAKLGYEVTPLRAIELIMFLNAP